MPEILHWQPDPGVLAPVPGEIHLWRIRTDARGMDLDRCLSALGEPQRVRAGKMRHVAYRDRYLRAHAGLRTILARYLRIPPQTIVFAYGPAGKPRLQSGTLALSFNLTTSGDLALVGLCAGSEPESELGVDCERLLPRSDLLGIAERMFEPAAIRALAAIPETARLALFYQFWTALEADAKSDGRGLFQPRANDAIRPAITHCIPETGYLAAIARARLPAVTEWLTFDLESGNATDSPARD